MTNASPTPEIPNGQQPDRSDAPMFVPMQGVDGRPAGQLDLTQEVSVARALGLRRREVMQQVLAGMALNAGPPVIPGQRQPSPES